MPTFKLPDGREAKLVIMHSAAVRYPDGTPMPRSTSVFLSVDGATVSTSSTCSPEDQFCRRVGRRLAAQRLLARLREQNVLAKEDREAVFWRICPEFSGGMA